jgi:hypothetical protein
MTDKTLFCYLGRPDGLGNRIEEIIRLDSICQASDSRCNYIWQNKQKNRSYEVLFTLFQSNINIITDEYQHVTSDLRQLSDFKDIEIGQALMLESARKITPAFDIKFDAQIKLLPIGVHIRSTDRIGKDHPHFMKDEDELKQYMEATLYYLNSSKPESVFICSESKRAREVFINHLDPSIKVVTATFINNTSAEYVDFFSLSMCREVWMVSKFSSFSITASLVGNVPLNTFVDDIDVRRRYLGIFQYYPLKYNGIISESLSDSSFGQVLANVGGILYKSIKKYLN